MPLSIPIETEPSKKVGQAALEFMLLTPLLLLFSSALFVSLSTALLHHSMTVDNYALARAHLYGQQLNECGPNKGWPSFIKSRLDYTCSFRGKVKSEVKLSHFAPSSPILSPVSIESKIDLEGIR